METEMQMKSDDNPQTSEDFPHVPGVTDVVLKVQDMSFHINKGIIIVASPVFHKMLTLDFKEKEEGVIELPNKTVDDVALFLKCLYPNHHVELTDQKVDALLPLAKEYMVQSLTQRCDEYLTHTHFADCKSKAQNLDLLMKFVDIGISYGTPKVQEKAIQAMAVSTVANIQKHELFQRFPDDIKTKIWREKAQATEIALSDVCHACSCQARSKLKNRESDLFGKGGWVSIPIDVTRSKLILKNLPDPSVLRKPMSKTT